MKKLIIMFLVLLYLCLQLTGCETMGWTEKGAIIGAAGGAIIGGIIGKGKGAAIGALSGAIVGAVAGHYYDRQVMTRAEAVKKYNYKGIEEKIEIEDSTIRPEEAKPDSTVEAMVLYSILLPDTNKDIKITEIRTLINGKDTIELSRREIMRAQGSHLSTMRFIIPKDIGLGEYTLVTSISDGKQTKTVKNYFKII